MIVIDVTSQDGTLMAACHILVGIEINIDIICHVLKFSANLRFFIILN